MSKLAREQEEMMAVLGPACTPEEAWWLAQRVIPAALVIWLVYGIIAANWGAQL